MTIGALGVTIITGIYASAPPAASVPLPADVTIAAALAATRTASLKLTLAGSVGIVADILLIAGCVLLAPRDGRYDEAASWAAMALQDNPDYQPGLRIQAASNAMAGRPEQAHKAIARLRQLNPALRVSNLKDLVDHRRVQDLSRYEEGLRRAGLPE